MKQIEQFWDDAIVPTLIDYIKIPAKSPLFDLHPFDVCGRFDDGGRGVVLWARNHEGALAMSASAELA